MGKTFYFDIDIALCVFLNYVQSERALYGMTYTQMIANGLAFYASTLMAVATGILPTIFRTPTVKLR